MVALIERLATISVSALRLEIRANTLFPGLAADPLIVLQKYSTRSMCTILSVFSENLSDKIVVLREVVFRPNPPTETTRDFLYTVKWPVYMLLNMNSVDESGLKKKAAHDSLRGIVEFAFIRIEKIDLWIAIDLGTIQKRASGVISSS